MVTDYEKVSPDDFYLTDEWLDDSNSVWDMSSQQIRDMAKSGELFEAFIVSALAYCTYQQMDSQMVYIDADNNVIVHCESEIIGNRHESCEKYDM